MRVQKICFIAMALMFPLLSEASECLSTPSGRRPVKELVMAWRDVWTIERLTALWERGPNDTQRDKDARPVRASWKSESVMPAVGCAVSVELNSDDVLRLAISVQLRARRNRDLAQKSKEILQELAVPDESRIRMEVSRHVTGSNPWLEYFVWQQDDRILGRKLAHGEVVSLEIQIATISGEREISFRYGHLTAPSR